MSSNTATLLTAVRRAIRARRLQLNLTTVEAAKRAMMAQPSWPRIENGNYCLSFDTIERVAAALNWPVSRLIRQAESDSGT